MTQCTTDVAVCAAISFISVDAPIAVIIVDVTVFFLGVNDSYNWSYQLEGDFSLVFQKFIIWGLCHCISCIILKFAFSFAVLLHTSCLTVVSSQYGLSLISSTWYLCTFSSLCIYMMSICSSSCVCWRFGVTIHGVSFFLHIFRSNDEKILLHTQRRLCWQVQKWTKSSTVQDWAEYELKLSSQMDLHQVLPRVPCLWAGYLTSVHVYTENSYSLWHYKMYVNHSLS